MGTTNTYGRWAASRPSSTAEAQLLAAGVTESYVLNIQVANQDSVMRTYSVALTATSGSAAVGEWLAKETQIEANSWHNLKAVIGNGQTVRVQSSSADKISFVAFGLKVVTV